MNKSDETPDLETWLKRNGREARVYRATHGVHEAKGHRATLLQDGKLLAVGYGASEESARADAWHSLAPRWRQNRGAELPPYPMDPFFIECVRKAASNKEFVAQFDRLTGSNLLRAGSPLELAIDQAAGRVDEELRKFLDFVKEFVYERLSVYNPHK